MSEKIEFNTVWLSLTYDCNNRCKWCYANSNALLKRDSLKEEEIPQIISFLKELGIKKTVLIGGEPTIYPGFFPLMKNLYSRNLNFGIVSNGRKFSEKNFAKRASEAGLKYATFSLCGKNATMHDYLTGIPGSFEETLAGLRNATQEGIKISTNLVINKATKNNLEGFVDSFANEQIQYMGFNICGPCIQEEKNNKYIINPKEGATLYEKIHAYALEKKIKTKLITPTPLCFFSDSFRNLPYFKEIVSGGPCQMVTGRNFVIDYNLDIVPCTHLTGFPLFNLKKEDKKLLSKEEFLYEMNDPKKQPAILRSKMNRYPSTECNGCYSNSCTGGCPLYWLKYDPELEITSKISSQKMD